MGKSPEEIALEIAQECISKAPVLVLGSGASAAHGIPGMPGLRDHLLSARPPAGAGKDGREAWTRFADHLKGHDLESALTAVQLPEVMTRFVIEATWDLLAPFDLQVFDTLVRDRTALPLTRLYQHLFKSTHSHIDVVTPNYDRLTEYAADAGELCHFTGFGYGYLRLRAKDQPPKIQYGGKQARTVNVWKVHGSLDWFRGADGVAVGLPLTPQRPAGLTPVIVTPGIEKYRLTHEEPFRSILAGADSALQSARGYLCIGYGFNDAHIQPKLVERCQSEPVPLVLIARTITPAAKAFFRDAKCQRYLALEASPKGCRMYSVDHAGGVEISGKTVWQLDAFLAMVT